LHHLLFYRLGKFQQLVTLRMNRSSLKTLPSEIGKLASLRELIIEAPKVKTLPKRLNFYSTLL